MTDVYVVRETTTNDGMGGVTTTTQSTLIPAAMIYQAGMNTTRFMAGNTTRFMADKMTDNSTHILVLEPQSYSFTIDDKKVTHAGRTFLIRGTPENIMEYDEIMVVPLEEQV